MEPSDVYFALLFFLAVCALALMLDYFIDYIHKEDR